MWWESLWILIHFKTWVVYISTYTSILVEMNIMDKQSIYGRDNLHSVWYHYFVSSTLQNLEFFQPAECSVGNIFLSCKLDDDGNKYLIATKFCLIVLFLVCCDVVDDVIMVCILQLFCVEWKLSKFFLKLHAHPKSEYLYGNVVVCLCSSVLHMERVYFEFRLSWQSTNTEQKLIHHFQAAFSHSRTSTLAQKHAHILSLHNWNAATNKLHSTIPNFHKTLRLYFYSRWFWQFKYEKGCKIWIHKTKKISAQQTESQIWWKIYYLFKIFLFVAFYMLLEARRISSANFKQL